MSMLQEEKDILITLGYLDPTYILSESQWSELKILIVSRLGVELTSSPASLQKAAERFQTLTGSGLNQLIEGYFLDPSNKNFQNNNLPVRNVYPAFLENSVSGNYDCFSIINDGGTWRIAGKVMYRWRKICDFSSGEPHRIFHHSPTNSLFVLGFGMTATDPYGNTTVSTPTDILVINTETLAITSLNVGDDVPDPTGLSNYGGAVSVCRVFSGYNTDPCYRLFVGGNGIRYMDFPVASFDGLTAGDYDYTINSGWQIAGDSWSEEVIGIHPLNYSDLNQVVVVCKNLFTSGGMLFMDLIDPSQPFTFLDPAFSDNVIGVNSGKIYTSALAGRMLLLGGNFTYDTAQNLLAITHVTEGKVKTPLLVNGPVTCISASVLTPLSSDDDFRFSFIGNFSNYSNDQGVTWEPTNGFCLLKGELRDTPLDNTNIHTCKDKYFYLGDPTDVVVDSPSLKTVCDLDNGWFLGGQVNVSCREKVYVDYFYNQTKPDLQGNRHFLYQNGKKWSGMVSYRDPFEENLDNNTHFPVPYPSLDMYSAIVWNIVPVRDTNYSEQGVV